MPGAEAQPPAEIYETHISVLFAYGDRVVKIHKPERFRFADFSTLERRRADAQREVELNRRLAPDVYLGVTTLSLEGAPVEHGILMRRLPASTNLAFLLSRQQLAGADIERVADTLAAFHRRAERSEEISTAGSPQALRERWAGTAADLAPFIGRPVDPVGYEELTTLADRFVAGRSPLLEQRIDQRRICDGHGDLQASDIFCLPDGPRLLDCLEFDDRLRHGDVLADVAFLAMDLERLGAPAAARLLVDRYRQRTGDPFPSSLLHYYVAARAHVRLLVECLRARQQHLDDVPPAAQLLELALSHVRRGRVRLVLVGGPPGSGKSSLAGELGRRLDAEVLSTDHLRRELAPAPLASRYQPSAREAVYRELCAEASRHLGLGRSVVLDATWTSAAMRAMARTVARDAAAELSELRCEAPAGVRMARVAARQGARDTESEATPGIALLLAGQADAWPEAKPLDTAEPLQRTVTAALGALGFDPD